MIRRRTFLAATSAAAALPRVGLAESEPGLAQAARSAGVEFGCAVGPWLWSESDFRRAVLVDCTFIVPEYEWKWDRLSARSRRCDTSPIRRYLTFAQQNGLAIRGHTLVWHRAMPAWYPASADRATAIKLMTEHIQTVVGCGAGRIPWWDVVNEAIDPESGDHSGLRRTPLLAQIGPDYIDIAFRAAAEADPAAKLVYNDYGLTKSWGEARRDALLRLLEGMRRRGTPIHAVGVQAHLDLGPNSFNPKALTRLCRQLNDLGLDLIVTELDVSGAADEPVAAVYRDFLSCVLELPNLRSISTWGLSDRHSWLTTTTPTARPLLYDTRMRKKAAWTAVNEALLSQSA